MPVIVRNYRQYKEWKMPIITLGLKYNEKWYPVDAYVDSGAIYSIFRQIFQATLGFSEKLGIGFNILGRTGVFDRFIICFDDMKNYVTFTY